MDDTRDCRGGARMNAMRLRGDHRGETHHVRASDELASPLREMVIVAILVEDRADAHNDVVFRGEAVQRFELRQRLLAVGGAQSGYERIRRDASRLHFITGLLEHGAAALERRDGLLETVSLRGVVEAHTGGDGPNPERFAGIHG